MAYNLSITGTPGDTLASVSKLSVSISPGELLRGRISIDRLFIEDGCFNLTTEGPGKYNNINRIFNSQPKPDSLKKPFRMPDMTVDEVILRNMRFALRNPAADTIPRAPSCVNFKNLSLKHIDARINRIRIEDNTLSCRIRDLSCSDRSGYEIQSLSGSFSLDSKESRMENLHLTDTYSEINAGYLSFGYNSGKDLKDFVNKIRLGADFHSSTIDFRSIGVFAEGLKDCSLKMNIEGEVTGPVSNLSTYDLSVGTGDGTYIRIGAAISGLPDIKSTFFNMNLKEVYTTSADLSAIISLFSSGETAIGTLMKDGGIILQGLAYGTLSDLYSIGELKYLDGKVAYEATLRSTDTSSTTVDASVSVDRLNIGSVIGKSGLIGETSLSTSLSAAIPDRRNHERLSVHIDSLQIHSIALHGTEYRDISMTGTMRDNNIDLRMLSHDTAFPAMFQSIVTLDTTNRPQRVRAFLDVPYADLKAMNLVRQGNISTAGITLNADLSIDSRSILGNILLDNISYADDNGRYHIDSLYIRSLLREDRHIVTLMSPLLHMDYSSNDSPARLAGRLKTALSTPSLAGILTADSSLAGGPDGYYDFHLRTFDMSPICDIISPGLSIADSTTVDIHLDKENTLTFNAQSANISLRNKKGKVSSLEDIGITADNRGNSLRAKAAFGKILSGDMTAENTLIDIGSTGREIGVDLSFNNSDTTLLDLGAGILLSRTSSGGIAADIDIDSSVIKIRRNRWELSPASLHLEKRLYTADSIRLLSYSDTLLISGAISEDPDRQLNVTLGNLDMSILNSFMETDLDLGGRLSGKIELFNFFSGMGASMEVKGHDLTLLGQYLGDLSILSRRDLAKDRFNILVNNYVNGNNPINASGYFVPGRNYINFNLSLKDLSLRYLSPLLSDFLTVSYGGISGDIGITGQPDMLILNSSNTHIDSLLITPLFTGVPYLIDGPVNISQRRIDLQRLSISDPAGSTGILDGSITHDFFHNIFIDAGLEFSNFMCLNTGEHDNDRFYGSAYASGNISMSGPVNSLVIDADVSTDDRTSIHVPMSSSSSASTTDLISYTDFRKQAEQADTVLLTASSENEKKTSSGNIEIRARAEITQGAELFIEMNKQLGEILRCTGNGNIDLTLVPSLNVMDMRGDYTIYDGSYHFALSIQSRDFLLNEGGTIAFNGDFKNTNLNVGATYRTKASISTLISDTTSVGNRRNVNCGIQLQGPLTNPELSFSIDIPDLDPITKGRVESALSTPDKVQKQFMALLISGSFVPDEQSGIVNNSTILYSNASEILSNQFNNIFRQLDIPLDLGLNYQPGVATGGKDMFDVAISYQAFNNRLIINGNVGNSETSSNWAGDFDAEIKVDRQGKLRITLFTRSADSYSNYLDNTQRSGFGITYQDEFDTFGDFWRNIFYSRKRKEEYELELLRKAEEDLEREAAEANIQKENVLKPKEDPMNFLEENGAVEYQVQEYTEPPVTYQEPPSQPGR